MYEFTHISRELDIKKICCLLYIHFTTSKNKILKYFVNTLF